MRADGPSVATPSSDSTSALGAIVVSAVVMRAYDDAARPRVLALLSAAWVVPGLLVAWDNMNRRGRPNPATRHAGMPVESGCKYVVTQWYRLEPWGGTAAG